LSEAPSGGELKLRIESELDEVRTNNLAPAITRRSALIEAATQQASIQPEIWRRVAAAGLIAALVCIATAVVAGHFRSR
jgi:hypothetical protein